MAPSSLAPPREIERRTGDVKEVVHQSDCNTTFCPPEQIQVITHIKHVSLLKIKSFLQQKYLQERLTIN
ncbi:MAG: hypothetical protein ACK5Y2_07820, partial [Bdellovibrionales bacterium]